MIDTITENSDCFQNINAIFEIWGAYLIKVVIALDLQIVILIFEVIFEFVRLIHPEK